MTCPLRARCAWRPGSARRGGSRTDERVTEFWTRYNLATEGMKRQQERLCCQTMMTSTWRDRARSMTLVVAFLLFAAVGRNVVVLMRSHHGVAALLRDCLSIV